MNAITIKLFAADGTWQGVWVPSDCDPIDEVLEAGGYAEVWRDGQRVFDDPATTAKKLAEQIAAAK